MINPKALVTKASGSRKMVPLKYFRTRRKIVCSPTGGVKAGPWGLLAAGLAESISSRFSEGPVSKH